MSEITTIGWTWPRTFSRSMGWMRQAQWSWSNGYDAARSLGSLPACRRCLIGMEACATAHHWARELTRLGHAVRLMPPQYVKAYVKRNKNDAADAAAICEAVKRPSMRLAGEESSSSRRC